MTAHPAFDLDWNLVRTFVGVAQAGSLAGGARRLGITHPTAARHIQQLEGSLNMVLFTRTSQGLLLNEAGSALLDSAQAMHASALSFQASSDGMRRSPVERVRFAVSEVLAELMPHVMLPELQHIADEPSDTPLVELLVTDELVDLAGREADIALRHMRPEQGDLICKRVGTVAMGAFAHVDYINRFGLLDAVSARSHRYVDGLTRDHLMRGAARRGMAIPPEQVVFRSDSVACRRAAVRAGWGIGAFPVWMAQREADWQPVFPEAEVIDLEVWLVARPELRNSRYLKGLFQRLGEGLARRLRQA